MRGPGLPRVFGNPCPRVAPVVRSFAPRSNAAPSQRSTRGLTGGKTVHFWIRIGYVHGHKGESDRVLPAARNGTWAQPIVRLASGLPSLPIARMGTDLFGEAPGSLGGMSANRSRQGLRPLY